MILVMEELVHQFLEACLGGEVSLSGLEPPIGEVLVGKRRLCQSQPLSV